MYVYKTAAAAQLLAKLTVFFFTLYTYSCDSQLRKHKQLHITLINNLA